MGSNPNYGLGRFPAPLQHSLLTSQGKVNTAWAAFLSQPNLAGAGFIFSPPGTSANNLVVASITDSVIVPYAATLYGWQLAMEAAPTGSAVIFDVLRLTTPSSDPTNSANWFSIFTQGSTDFRPQMPIGTAVEQSGGSFIGADPSRSDYQKTTVSLGAGDRLRGLIAQVGSSTPGGSAKLQVYWR